MAAFWRISKDLLCFFGAGLILIIFLGLLMLTRLHAALALDLLLLGFLVLIILRLRGFLLWRPSIPFFGFWLRFWIFFNEHFQVLDVFRSSRKRYLEKFEQFVLLLKSSH